MNNDPLRNGKDPLRDSGPQSALDLFREFSKAANGRPNEQILDAAVNMILNVIRQSNASGAKAAAQFDEIAGRAKHLLMEKHYDNAGNRRNIFPYSQHVTPEWVDGRSDWQKRGH